MTGLRAAVTLRSLATMAVLLAATVSPAQDSKQSPADRAKGVVQIEGRAIESLVLTDAAGRERTFTKPEGQIVVPAGRYRVTTVEVAEGYQFEQGYSVSGAEWFEVTAKAPTKLAAGAPLVSTVTASRQGSVLELDYALVDADGRKYSPGTRGQPPTFKVFHGDRQVGSGKFAYG